VPKIRIFVEFSGCSPFVSLEEQLAQWMAEDGPYVYSVSPVTRTLVPIDPEYGKGWLHYRELVVLYNAGYEVPHDKAPVSSSSVPDAVRHSDGS
jgi:hypothetical protein